MASNTSSKKAGNTPASNGEPAVAGGGNKSPQDVRLLAVIRTNRERICASLLSSAAQYGEQRNWAEMQEYQALAQQFQEATGGARAMAAGAR